MLLAIAVGVLGHSNECSLSFAINNLLTVTSRGTRTALTIGVLGHSNDCSLYVNNQTLPETEGDVHVQGS